MSRQDDVLRLMESLHIATPVQVAKCLKNPTHSGRVQAQRSLNSLVELNLLRRKDGFYLLPDCKSVGGVHALAVSDVISEIHFRFENPHIYRETLIEGNIRPDVIALVRKNGYGACFIVEVTLQESENYLKMKENFWLESPEACQYLSNLFGTKILNFSFVTSETLNQLWEELCGGS